MPTALSKALNEGQDGLINFLPSEMILMIFNLLDLKDLQSCRCVHSVWQKHASDAMKKMYEITFKEVKDLDRLNRLKEFLTVGKNLQPATISVNLSTYEPLIPASRKTVADFFKAVSSSVKNLSLTFHLHKEFFFKEDFPKLSYPQLQSLKLKLVLDPQSIFATSQFQITKSAAIGLQKFFAFIENMLENAASLSEIIMDGVNDCGNITSAVFINTLKRSGSFSGLRILKLESPVMATELIQLTEMNLKLTSLKLFLPARHVLKSEFKALLDSLSNSLVELEIRNWNCAKSFADCIELPFMKKLQSLVIDSSALAEVEDRVPEDCKISCSKLLPRLKKLSFLNSLGGWECFFQKEDIPPFSELTELQMSRHCFMKRPVMFASTLFPGIKKLFVSARTNIISGALKNLTALEELTFDTTDTRRIDHIVTGMSEADCKAILKQLKEHQLPIDGNLFNRQLSTMPMSALKSLKTLRLWRMRNPWGDHNRKMVEMTQLSFLFLLENMPSLECLDFFGRQYPQNIEIPMEVWKRVKERFLIK